MHPPPCIPPLPLWPWASGCLYRSRQRDFGLRLNRARDCFRNGISMHRQFSAFRISANLCIFYIFARQLIEKINADRRTSLSICGRLIENPQTAVVQQTGLLTSAETDSAPLGKACQGRAGQLCPRLSLRGDCRRWRFRVGGGSWDRLLGWWWGAGGGAGIMGAALGGVTLMASQKPNWNLDGTGKPVPDRCQ